MAAKTKVGFALGQSAPFIAVQPPPIIAKRDPTEADNQVAIGQLWLNNTESPFVLSIWDGETWGAI